MRISDWSSDVCSSDLREAEPRVETAALGIAAAVLAHQLGGFLMPPDRAIEQLVGEPRPRDQHRRAAAELERRALGPLAKLIDRAGRHAHPLGGELHRPGGGEMLEQLALERGGPVIARSKE